MQKSPADESVVRFDFAFIKNGLYLLLPGLITSFALVFFSSGSAYWIERNTITYIIQVVQLQLMGVTICKFGIDQISFALLQNNTKQNIEVKKIFLKRIMPLSIAFSLFVMYFYNFATAGILCITVLLEVYSIVTITEHNANKNFLKSGFIAFLGYPFFFIIIFICSKVSILSNNIAVLILLSTCFVRFLISTKLRLYFSHKLEPHYSIQAPLLQSLNYFVFRFDQVLLSTLFVSSILYSTETFSINDYIYFTKLPELASGVLTGLGAIFLNDFSVTFEKSMITFIKKHSVFLTLILVGILVLTLLHIGLGKFELKKYFHLYPAYIINALLILPVNIITFILLKNGKINYANRFYFISIIFGLLLLGISIVTRNGFLLSWVVPTQMILYLLCYSLQKRKKYVEAK